MSHQTPSEIETEYFASERARPDVVEGLIKVKLIHSAHTSVLLPDLLAVDLNGWRWLQPKFFTGCWLQFLDDFGAASLRIDLNEHGPRLTVRFASTQFVRRFDDGSQLYRCLISGAQADDLSKLTAGECQLSGDSNILLALYHHTKIETVKAIEKSEHFKGSAWNIQGTKKLHNVEYVYFTSLPKIDDDLDLQRIGMASDGWMHFLPTNGRPPLDVVSIRVYRENTMNRRAAIKALVPAQAIASQHVYLHRPIDEPAHYEICHPEIFRVGLVPHATLPFDGVSAFAPLKILKRFDYVVLGDADTPSGLSAPYDEEETTSVFHIERCDEMTLFEFWARNANTDQVTGRDFEAMTFQGPPSS